MNERMNSIASNKPFYQISVASGC